jgi:LCP family protein required for cell wall assembly
MPADEKPYRVYRGGRVKGKVPAPPRRGRPQRSARGERGDGRVDYRGPGARDRGVSWGKRIALGLVVVLLLAIVWGVASYFSFRSGVDDANRRLDPNTRLALADQSGLLMSHPTTILLLGTDHNKVGGREGDRHSDSIMLVRTDPEHHRLAFLSIPRDLRVEIPGYSEQKINAAYQLGGPALAIKTVRGFTDVEVNHVVIVDFDAFTKVIDKVGGVDIDVPGPILSNKFDCPYATQARCDRWQGWRFAKGTQHMNGQRARVYSRIRENKLNPRESDVTRTERQQAVIQALLAKLTSVGVLAKLPFVGDDVMKPLTTDLTAGQMMQLALVKKRSGNQLHCHVGGTPTGFGGGYLQPDEEARRTIAAFLGRSAPQPPLPGSAFGSGCN